MTVQAKAKFIHMSPRKTRLVVDLVRGMDVISARHQLQFSKKDAAKPVLKALNSAIANAENNKGLSVKDLFISEARVDEGPTFYRYTPRAHGRASAIRKRMSHIIIGVSEREASKQKEEVKVEKKETKKPVAKKVEKKVVAKKTTRKTN